MTTTDKVLLTFAILAGLAAPVLLAGAIKARESRMQDVDTSLAKLEGLDDELIEAKADVKNRESELLSVSLQWGRPTGTGQTQIIDPRQGLVQYGVGLGGANADGPTVHTFGVNPDGTGSYIGEFKITASQPAASTGKLTRIPLPNEANFWNAQSYRVRTKVPPSYTNLIDELLTDYNIAAQDLQEEQVRLTRARKQLSDSQQILANREAELGGDAGAADDADSAVKEGLVSSIEDATAERDQLLASVDRLRRDYRNSTKELNSILKEIRELAGRLPTGQNGMASGVIGAPSVR